MKNSYLSFLITVFFFFTACILKAQCPAGNIQLQTQAEVDNFSSNYPGCTNLSGSLTIGPSTDIVNLNGLAGITNISSLLSVIDNNVLVDLNGLNAITTLGNGLQISGNALVTAIPSFTSLTNINGGKIHISANPLLQNIDLSTVSAPNLTVISIVANPVLTNLDLPTDITTLSSFFDIRDNPLLSSISEHDNLVSIGGYLELNNSVDPVLPAFPNLQSIGNGLIILYQSQISALPTFSSLSNINGGQIHISANPLLQNIDLSAISAPNLTFISIVANPVLTNLDLPTDITTLSSFFDIRNDPILESINDQNNIISIGTYLEITQTSVCELPSFSSLESIGTIASNLNGLHLIGNANITKLNEFPSLITLDSTIAITNNPLLTNCAIQAVCDFLPVVQYVNITGNPGDCLDEAAVLNHCTNGPTVTPPTFPNDMTAPQGSYVSLVITNLPPNHEAVWYDADMNTVLYQDVANNFQYQVNQTVTLYGAFVPIGSSCTSPLEGILLEEFTPVSDPVLDANTSVITVCAGDMATLVLETLAPDEIVIWFDDANMTNQLYTFSANFFQPVVTQTTTFYAAIENTVYGVLSDLFPVTVTTNPVPVVEITKSNLSTWCQGIKVLNAKVANPADLTYPLTFAWSDGLGGSPTVVAPANGTYYVTVTDDVGCTSVASTVVNVDISTLISTHTIIAEDALDMDESTILSGGVGVLDGEEVSIQNNSDITTFLRAANAAIDGSSTVADYINSDSPIILPAFFSNGFNDNNSVYVPSGGSMTLSGSNYGSVTVGKNATLNINNVNIYLKSLTMLTGATLNFYQPTNMMVKKKVNIGMMCNVNVEGPTTVIYAGDRASVGQGSVIQANIYAPEGLEANDSGSSLTTYMTGLFIGNDEVTSGDNVVWGWNLNCSSLSDGGNGEGEGEDLSQPDSQGAQSIIQNKTDLLVYPNPTSGILNIDLTDYMEQSINLTIYNTLSEVVWSKQIDALQTSLLPVNLSGFANGLYFLSLTSNGKRISRQIVLNK